MLEEVRRTVEDSGLMRGRAAALIDELEREPPPIDAVELDETKAFLAWVADGHFTFLGYREYDLVLEDGEAGLRAIPDSGLGMLRGAAGAAVHEAGPEGARDRADTARTGPDQG